MAAGRPSKYSAAYCEQAYKYCLLGATDGDLARLFEVHEDTINEWKVKHPRFSVSLKRGKDEADAVVASKLFHRATGYEHPEVDIKVIDGKIVKTELTKHYAPDTTAMIFWLKNRQKENWRDKSELENSGESKLTVEVLNYHAHDSTPA